MLSWFWDLFMSMLGLRDKKGTILLLGLDFAGKTTFLNLLKTGKFSFTAPTGISSTEEIILNTGNKTLKLTSIDLGGHKQIRRVWKEYYYCADAVLFFIDATDRERLLEAKNELHELMEDPVMKERKLPIAILGNKIDRAHAIGRSDLLYLLEIFHLTGEGKQGTTGDCDQEDQIPVDLFMCSLLNKQGYGEAMRWLACHF